MINWRWYLFWVKDWLTGGKIYEAYKELSKNTTYNAESTQEKIHKLILHAKENTEFYANIETNNIKNFPVINKAIIKENQDNFIAKNYKDKKLHRMSTSGSTGIPFTVVQNSEKRKRVLAELLYYNKEIGYTFGEKQVFFRVWTEKNKKSRMLKFLQNLIAEDISDLSNEKLLEISENLKRNKKIRNILSYASTLDVLSTFMVKNNLANPNDYSVKSILSGSEILQDRTRENLKKIFNCNIVSRYSNQENGVIAQEYVASTEMRLNNTNYYIEFLKQNSDEEAREGELSRVVITDLYNYAMPMIRYDTGDLAIYSDICICKGRNERVIREIYGRRVDTIYDTKGNVISPHTITNNMWSESEIKQFKFQQTDEDEYKIIINKGKNINTDELKLINKFKNILGQDAHIYIEYVNEIPVLSSGKRKYIENVWKNKEVFMSGK